MTDKISKEALKVTYCPKTDMFTNYFSKTITRQCVQVNERHNSYFFGGNQ